MNVGIFNYYFGSVCHLSTGALGEKVAQMDIVAKDDVIHPRSPRSSPLDVVLRKLTYGECVDDTFVKTATYVWSRPENLMNILRLRKTETEAAVRRDPYEYCAGCERRGDVFLVSFCNLPARVWAVWALGCLGAASGVKRCL